MEPDDLQDLPVERRRQDRRRRQVPVPNDRRQTDRRANRLEPSKPFAGVAVVVDGWPLLRAGVRQLLSDSAMRVASDTPSAKVAAQAIGDRLDLAVIGASKEPLEEAIKRLRALPGPDPDMPPRVLVLLERVDVVQLRGILSMGVEGVIDRSVGLDDLRAACERLLAGQRVLAGSPLSVLATAGLELQEPEPEEEERDNGLLTRKELEVLAELGRHLSNREIAETMHVSAATVKTHLSNIYGKLGVTSRREAVVAAVERGLLS
ncbi:DNA-binding response regulator, LuxR family [Euzebya pacifica]|uniref:DNA-binding response regulator, LuxR family n=1 Tax=Euzebya pacifica TaxID=1608957 RepID=A0A346XUJ6_9ACTN|nr:response regulator transcription factor [Euzebya pacifica]AXV05893.1 DNA-binding response regulator, LuxR family [Euzebya pacifica]